MAVVGFFSLPVSYIMGGVHNSVMIPDKVSIHGVGISALVFDIPRDRDDHVL